MPFRCALSYQNAIKNPIAKEKNDETWVALSKAIEIVNNLKWFFLFECICKNVYTHSLTQRYFKKCVCLCVSVCTQDKKKSHQ